MPSVVSRLLSGTNINPTIEDVPDVDIQNSLKELLSVNTETDFQTKIQSFPERFSAGVTKLKVNFDDKLEFIENICGHYCSTFFTKRHVLLRAKTTPVQLNAKGIFDSEILIPIVNLF